MNLPRVEALLAEKSVVKETAPPVPEILRALEDRAAGGQHLRVMYGETYDTFGATLDSLKYYFEVSRIGRALGAKGPGADAGAGAAGATATILIADVATCRNAPEDQHAGLMETGRSRAEHVRRVSEVFSLGLTVLLMSEYLHTDSFQQRLGRIKSVAAERPKVFDWVKQTVPESKVAVEAEKGFAYAFEEIATIIDYDLKVGPPREKFYDEPARMIARAVGEHPLASVYLHPTYPLGLGVDFFFNNEEIERYGVTAYKAGSKGLSDNRVVLEETPIGTPFGRTEQLIDASFVGKKPNLPNAVLDVALIAEMARQRLSNEAEVITLREDLAAGRLSPADLKRRARDGLFEYVLKPLRLDR